MAPKVEPWYPPQRERIFALPVAMRASSLAPRLISTGGIIEIIKNPDQKSFLET